MEYEVYHDESQVGGFWHGVLFVPLVAKARLLNLLQAARTTTGYPAPLSFKGVRRPGPKFECAKAWITIGIAAMVSKPFPSPVPVYLGKSTTGEWCYQLLHEPSKAKFVLFCERDALSKMSGHSDHASKVETTFRMALKGGMHFFGTHDEPVTVARIHLDGHLHYRRHVDRARIADRLTGLREYCHLSNRGDLILDDSSDHTRPDSQPYDDCQLLQLADLLIGAFRTSLRGTEKAIQMTLAYPAVSVLTRFAQGPARMANSRWRNSLAMSQCYLEDGKWRFEPLEASPGSAMVQLGLPLS